ncbi:MAG: chromosome segregation protein SMC [Porticoccaceae bacterium]|nr:chromosome segregation protein SMC [Porticoccaceae bacterium]
MRLKSIKLSGFKSFVDPTTVHFPSNLCAVVGPNGCGKSNVIDAVRWVLGESSAKNLRGESMSDVIFNGSGTRKPVGQASIELIFDNSDARVSGEFAAYSEISIRRKVSRDGQSQYYLNGSSCRRRDITDIFLGTGLGPRSYAIIEQGTISRLIEAKPDELRVFIEEAAGISKYKERRRETANRMARTEENLERLRDIRDELTRQLTRLERQAKAAQKYTQFRREERQKKLELSALKWRELNSSMLQQQKVIQRLEVDQEGSLAQRNACDTAIEKYRLQLTEAGDTLDHVQSHYYKVSGSVARIQQAIEHARERSAERQQDIRDTQENYDEACQHLAADRDKVTVWNHQYEQLKPQLDAAEKREIEALGSLDLAQTAMQDWQRESDDFTALAALPRQQVEVQQSRIGYLDDRVVSLKQRQQDLDAEAGSFEDAPERAEMAHLEVSLGELALSQQASENQRQECTDKIANVRQQLQKNQQELNHLRERQQTFLGRRASLEALQQAAMNDNQSQQWINDHGWREQPRLADSVDPIAGWETAVETVLGNYLQAVMIEDLGASSEILPSFKKGELLLIDGSPCIAAEPMSEEQAPRLASLVAGDAAAALLGHVFAVHNLSEALAMRENLQAHESVVTRDGIWIGVNWLRMARDIDTSVGVLKRKQELQTLVVDMHQLEDQLGQAEAFREAHQQALQAEEAAGRDNAANIDAQQRQYAESRAQLSAFEVQIEQFKARKERAEKELNEVARLLISAQSDLSLAQQALREASDLVASNAQLGAALGERRSDLQAHLHDCRNALTEQRDRREQLGIQVGGLSVQRTSAADGIARLEAQVLRLQRRREELAVADGDEPEQDQQQDLDNELASQLRAEQELRDAKAAVEAIEHGRREQEKGRAAVESELTAVGAQLETERLAARELSTLCGTIEEHIVRDQGHLKELLETLEEDAELLQWEEELELLGKRIHRLGPINLAAIEEYQVESERKAYLDRQNDELVDALTTLQSAIQKIDRETRTRFKDTFDMVNQHLQELFPKLFGGGEAYLEITGEDLLDTGVTLMARPPGKKNSSIYLLSGGEKALTAIAMVFAIFKLNPAPFCMLDEVDAPLDDANVGRYAAVVREMSSQVQFIYITHNKISMEAANQLMGVTMHEAGVSRIVSVDVNEAAKLAGST